jgi:uncharacterized protein YbaR (Trm112 family)
MTEQGLDGKLLEIIRCPSCRGTFADPTTEEITCSSCGLAYPIRHGVPVLLLDEARRTTD